MAVKPAWAALVLSLWLVGCASADKVFTLDKAAAERTLTVTVQVREDIHPFCTKVLEDSEELARYVGCVKKEFRGVANTRCYISLPSVTRHSTLGLALRYCLQGLDEGNK